jgi:hypothetical protein
MEKKLSIAVILMIVFFFNQNIFAQFETKTNIVSMYDDNVNNNSLNLKSMVSTLNINTGYLWEGEASALKLFYDGSYSYFTSLTERTNHFHSGNLEYTHLSGDESQNILNLGTSFGLGMNRDAYTIFDHNLFSAYVNYKYFPAEWFINKFGYTLRVMSFSSLSDLSYTEHALFAHTAFAVTQATTLILQADLGSKFYSTAISGENTTAKKGMNSIMPGVTQLTGTLKIGQKITEVTGLSLISKYQWNIQKQSRYLSSDYGLISDDELFDDHYGYEGLQTGFTLTQILTETATAKLSGGIQDKLYSTLAAYDMDGNLIADQRSDVRTYFSLQIHKNFDALGFSIKASTDLIYNKSNDPLYNYHNNAFALEIEVPF